MTDRWTLIVETCLDCGEVAVAQDGPTAREGLLRWVPGCPHAAAKVERIEVCPVTELEGADAHLTACAHHAGAENPQPAKALNAVRVLRRDYDEALAHVDRLESQLARIGDDSDPLDGMDSAQFARLTWSTAEAVRAGCVAPLSAERESVKCRPPARDGEVGSPAESEDNGSTDRGEH